MNTELFQVFEKLQLQTKLLLKDVSSLSSVTYHHKPAEGKWAISQILTHILTSERMSLEYMKKKSLGIETAGETGIIERIKFFILKISQRIPLRYKAPRKIVEQTPSPLSFGDLVRQWEIVRSDMKDFLETIEEKNVQKKIFRHPTVGRLNIIQGVQFLLEHLNHHRPQILTIIENQRKQKLEKR